MLVGMERATISPQLPQLKEVSNPSGETGRLSNSWIGQSCQDLANHGYQIKANPVSPGGISGQTLPLQTSGSPTASRGYS